MFSQQACVQIVCICANLQMPTLACACLLCVSIKHETQQSWLGTESMQSYDAAWAACKCLSVPMPKYNNLTMPASLRYPHANDLSKAWPPRQRFSHWAIMTAEKLDQQESCLSGFFIETAGMSWLTWSPHQVCAKAPPYGSWPLDLASRSTAG